MKLVVCTQDLKILLKTVVPVPMSIFMSCILQIPCPRAIKRNAEVKPKITLPKYIAVAVDLGNIKLTKQVVLHLDWFNTACQNPTLVASIMSSIATRVINESIYLAQR